MSPTNNLLIELGTEELPPTALLKLSEAFTQLVVTGLKELNLSMGSVEPFATPRRLAVRVNNVPSHTPTENVTVWGPPQKVGFDADGNPTKAGAAFAKKNNVSVDDLGVENDGKIDKLVFKTQAGGELTAGLIPALVQGALAKLPISKRMRWGASRNEFVRPVHWLVLMLGDQVVSGELLGLSAGNTTRGHRFHADRAFAINHADDYEAILKSAYVIASVAAREKIIIQQVQACGEKLRGQAVISEDLLAEVTGLVEWPVAVAGNFDTRFLQVPSEALISSMKEHQKYFHVVDANNNLLPNFITVANIESTDVAQVIAGNERVIRPRLADAAFFFEQDKKVSLDNQREKLSRMVFQAKLGTLYDKTERIAALAKIIATEIGAEPSLAHRAGQLSKADLVTSMVYEFADLQGIAGSYYAANDGEAAEVAAALTEQYMPRFAKDSLPKTQTGTVLALADRLDTLAGIFGLGQVPTGSKDPFALRRASLAVLRLLIENNLALDLKTLLQHAVDLYPELPKGHESVDLALNYMLERLRSWYEDAGIDIAIYQAVSAKNLSEPLDINHRIYAVTEFNKLPEAQALAAANKRVSNILAKQQTDVGSTVDNTLLVEPAEVALSALLSQLQQEVVPLLKNNNFKESLAVLAQLRASVDTFFDDVMVMAEDEALRNNRLSLLAQLRNSFLAVADISFLAAAK